MDAFDSNGDFTGIIKVAVTVVMLVALAIIVALAIVGIHFLLKVW